MAYPTYSTYKAVDNIGFDQIPTAWINQRLKFKATYNDEVLPENMPPDTEIHYVDISSVDLISGITKVDGLTFEKAPSRARRIVRDGDTIVSTVRTYLKAIASIVEPPENMIVSTGFAVIRPTEKISKSYLSYCLQSQPFIDTVMANSVGVSYPAINTTELARIQIAFPSIIAEQMQIANFLDYKTTQIDRLIDKKKQLIEKLNEKRIAVITQAVTKGLDPSVPMKDSEVDWLGKVPKHWDVRRLRFAIESNPVKSQIKDIEGDTLVSFVPMDAVTEDGFIRLDTEKTINEVYTGYTYFQENDVVVAKITPCFENGKGAMAEGLVNGIAFGTTEFHVMRPINGNSSKWLYYLSASHPFRQIGASEMYGAGGQKRVPESFIKDFRVGVPNFAEQEKIVMYIENQLMKISELLQVNYSTINKLQEYRTALITAAVTGKIDVRGIEIPNQEADNLGH